MQLHPATKRGTTVAETAKYLAGKQAKGWPGSRSIKGRLVSKPKSQSDH